MCITPFNVSNLGRKLFKLMANAELAAVIFTEGQPEKCEKWS
jgi:hypothetical protein